MMFKNKHSILKALAFSILALTLSACGESGPNTRSIYMLIDTSGTYTKQLDKAQVIINYMLASLDSGDSFAVARIDSGSFSEKDIIAKVTFDDRPSVANSQKRAFKKQIDSFVKSVKPSPYTDISGGILQAAEYLNETGAKYKRIFIFSDLKEELKKGHLRDFILPLDGIQVIALNVTKLSSDNIDPREYMKRIEAWNDRVTEGGGSWTVVNDLDRLEGLLVN